jgi:hypothetical protein
MAKELSRSFDTLHLSYRSEIPSSIIASCRAAKAALFSSHEVIGTVDIGSLRFAISRNGIKNYPYVLSSSDIRIFLSARPQGSALPTAEIHLGSLSCQCGAQKVLDRLHQDLVANGLRLTGERVTRFDFAVDYEMGIYEFFGQFSVDRFITYATKIYPCYTHGKMTGVQLGKGDIVVVIYDKILEMTEKKDHEKIEYYKRKWGRNTEKAVRVEVRFRGAAIRQFCPQKRTFRDIYKAMSRFWTYATREWVRYCHPFDRTNKNQKRSIITRTWARVQSIFTYADPSRNTERKTVPHKALIQQAIGCLSSVVAATGLGSHSPGAIMRTMHDILSESLFPMMFTEEWKAKYETKRAKSTVCF